MPAPKPIVANPVRKLTWRLLGGDSRWYGPAWGDYGTERIRDEFSRLYLLTSGYAVVRTDETKHILNPGRLYLLPAGTSAFYSTPEGMHLSWLHFNLYVQPGIDLLEASSPPLSVIAQEHSLQSFKQMLDNLRTGTPAGLSRACSIAGRFVTPFLTCDWSDVFRRDDSASRIRTVIAYIQANLAAPLTLAELARIAGVHPVYLSRLFKKATGMPPAKYVTAARMNYASDQLRLTGKRVSEIGSESGFEDPYHFSRAFKQYVGVAPRVYRQARAAF